MLRTECQLRGKRRAIVPFRLISGESERYNGYNTELQEPKKEDVQKAHQPHSIGSRSFGMFRERHFLSVEKVDSELEESRLNNEKR